MIAALSVKDITEQIPLEVHCKLSSDKIEQLSDSEETPLQAQSELDTVKSVRIEPRSISKYHSVEILPPDESRPPKSFSFEERLDINLDRLFANIRRIQENQGKILGNQAKFIKYKGAKVQPVQYYLAKKLQRLSTRICCANTISILTFLGATTVFILTLVILYRYMV